MKGYVILAMIAVAISAIPVFVMLPLDCVNTDGTIKDKDQLGYRMRVLSERGAEGVMLDFWWGIIERNERNYDFGAYLEIIELARQYNLKFQAIMSFHRCGGNVGDACKIPIPSWVLEVGRQNEHIFYHDREGKLDEEVLSSWIDKEALFNGRTPMDMYHDFMVAFKKAVEDHFGTALENVIDEVMPGLGACGELRYPGYQMDRWSFPGVGEFQCHDKYALADLAQAAASVGHPEWGNGSPSNAGGYNSRPDDTGFYRPGAPDNYQSEYGKFFLQWYADKLMDHGRRMFNVSRTVFPNMKLSVKLSGIHWWYLHDSHAAELTTGYYNTNGNDYYRQVSKLASQYNIGVDFTCMEMKDSSQPWDFKCGPEELVHQMKRAARDTNVRFSGENALENWGAWDQILYMSIADDYKAAGFTFLRMNDNMFDGWKLDQFTNFIQRMKQA